MRSKDTRSEYIANLGLDPKKGLESNLEPPRGVVGQGRSNTIIPPSEWALEPMEEER